jgi:hypothetical protein
MKPEPQPTVDERKTKELCGAEHEGVRCMRSKGHAGEHEALTPLVPIRWRG